MTERHDDDRLADALRASLAAHADHAPSGDLLAERILHSVGRRTGRWTRALPLLAAAAVAVVVLVAVGIASYHPEPHRPAAAPSIGPQAPAPSPHRANGTADAGTLRGVRILDLTFAGVDDGWALASADCIHGSGRCTALLRSTDGRSWHSTPGAAFNVPGVQGCADPCVSHLRFANDSVGYAFGPQALLMTTDGGRTWTREPGGADALETLDGNVIRVTDPGDCVPGCPYSVQLAPIGSTSWHTVSLPGQPGGVAQLVRTGNVAALQVYGNPAGGAPAPLTTLFTSRDDGAHWTNRGEPCPQQRPSSANPHGEIDSSRITSASDGSLTVLCTPRVESGPQFTATSTDGGAHFAAGDRRALGAAGVAALAAASRKIILVSSDDTYRSADGGQHFARLGANSGSSPGPSRWLGFESASVGHAISRDGRTIWTTRDAGQAWTHVRFR